jgi:hypothetical protein
MSSKPSLLVAARFRRARIKLAIFVLVATIGIYAVTTLYPDDDTGVFIGTIIAPIPAAFAAGFAVMVVIRQGIQGLFGKAYFALALGLGLFLAAELVWAHNVIGLGIELPFPSIADALWLSGYAPFGYAFYYLSKVSSKRKSKRTTFVVSLVVFLFSMLYVQQILAVSDDPSDFESLLVVSISIAYPVLDAILVIPALIAVLSAGRGYLTSVPWIFIAWVLYVVADSLFGFSAVMGLEDFSISDAYYNGAYLCMAAGMIWHNRYLIFDEKKFKDISRDLKSQDQK